MPDRNFPEPSQYIQSANCLLRLPVVTPMVRFAVDNRIRGIALCRSGARVGNVREVWHHHQLK